jgi:glycosyltransferase involved in cell wall biosynthesis
MKSVLHVGNIAHNAYFNNLILRNKGQGGCVVHPDAYHFASCPEWLILGDQGVTRAMLGDDYFPNFFQFEKSDTLRPEWFFQGPSYQVFACLYSLGKARWNTKNKEYRSSRTLMDYLRYKCIYRKDYAASMAFLTKTEFSQSLKDLNVHASWITWLKKGFKLDQKRQRFIAYINTILGSELSAENLPFLKSYLEYTVSACFSSTWMTRKERVFLLPSARSKRIKRRAAHLIRWSLRNPEKLKTLGLLGITEETYDPAQRSDLAHLSTAPYGQIIPFWDCINEFFKHRIFYGAQAIFPAMSIKGLPYAAYEHGTIRSLPFQDNDYGRLIKNAYENANVVMITNADYVKAKRRLEFDPEKIVYIPHGFDDDACLGFLNSFKKEPRIGNQVRFFAPARHAWVDGDDGHSKGNELIVHAVQELTSQGHTNFCVTMLEYGADVVATKKLIQDLSLGDYFEWHPTMTRGELWKWYANSDAVLDQFYIPAIGQIGVEAIALGARLINADNGSMTEFFGDPSPILSANTAHEVAEQMRTVLNDPDDTAGMGDYGRAWFARNHSSQAIGSKLEKTLSLLENQAKA